MSVKINDKQAGDLMSEYAKSIQASTPVDITEKNSDKIKRIAKLEAEPEEWFKYYFPKYYGIPPTPPMPFHTEATKRIIAHQEWYEVRSWSREMAKSTRTMFEVLYLTLVGNPVGNAKYKRKQNILLISNSEATAIRLLSPYKINLESNDRIKNDYGIQENNGSWTDAEFITTKQVAFRAIGAGQAPRGTKNEQIRPDVILFDDLDTDEDCRNNDIIKKRWEWVQEAVIPTSSISNPLLVIFCGNIIAKDCCIVRAQKFADNVEIINIRDENGKSNWPTKNTEEFIDRRLSLINYAAIQKEYYNNPIYEGSVFKEMFYKSSRPLNEYSTLVCYTDPSYKESKKNDYKATVLCGKWRGEFHVIKAFVFQGSTAQMIENHFAIMEIVSSNACYYFMEEVFLQEMFFKDFYEAGRVRGKTIPIAGDQRAKPDKFVRIESLLDPLNRNEKLFLNEDEKNNPGMKILEEQFLAFGPSSRAHDDGPDAVEGAIWIINNKESIRASGAITHIKRSRDNSKIY